MKRKLIKEPVFNTYCEFVWDCSLTELEKYLRKKYKYQIDIDNALAKLIVVHDQPEPENSNYIDWIIWFSHENELIHEISHLVFSQMRFKGIPITEYTEEVFTHLLDYYLYRIKNEIKKQKS